MCVLYISLVNIKSNKKNLGFDRDLLVATKNLPGRKSENNIINKTYLNIKVRINELEMI